MWNEFNPGICVLIDGHPHTQRYVYMKKQLRLIGLMNDWLLKLPTLALSYPKEYYCVVKYGWIFLILFFWLWNLNPLKKVVYGRQDIFYFSTSQESNYKSRVKCKFKKEEERPMSGLCHSSPEMRLIIIRYLEICTKKTF